MFNLLGHSVVNNIVVKSIRMTFSSINFLTGLNGSLMDKYDMFKELILLGCSFKSGLDTGLVPMWNWAFFPRLCQLYCYQLYIQPF